MAPFGFSDIPPMSNRNHLGESPVDEDLAVLRILRDGGQLSTDEYEEPVNGHLDASVDPGDTSPNTDVVAEEQATEDEAAPPERPTSERPSLRGDLNASYLGTLAGVSIVLLVASWAGLLSWFVSIGVVLVLLTTLFQGWRRVTLTGAVLVAAIMIVGVVTSPTTVASESPPTVVSETPPTTQQSAAATTLPPPDPGPQLTGSLHIHMDEVSDLWNTVAGPQVTSGLTRHTESGEYDSFIYRFGEWGRLAGAFDPDTEAVYALLAAGQFSNEATDQLYVNLCFMVEQFSPECLESYQELGLNGAALEEFADTTHEAEWTVGADTWRLQIEGNVLTIRVFGADAVSK
jgi:hypothetical protein